ncbi:hypothetical protein IFM5058_09511 [Aspergillus udagawae]|nr:hypothetical protein IFM5058_09511 [Aspergillus udagawae]
MVFLLNLYIALFYDLIYVWFESIPIVFGEIYHFNLGQLGLAFLDILIAALLTIPPYYWWMHMYLEPHFDGQHPTRSSSCTCHSQRLSSFPSVDSDLPMMECPTRDPLDHGHPRLRILRTRCFPSAQPYSESPS